MNVLEHSERLMVAADAYARAFAEYGYGPEGDLKRNALKEAIRAVAADHQGAVEALDAIARVIDRGTADERKLATISRLVNAARSTTARGR